MVGAISGVRARMRALRSIAALLCAIGSTEAKASGWESFEEAFPVFPCQDGWMACLVASAPVDPDLQQDSAGRKLSADGRIGWFDLRATSTFSPFPGLSDYPAPEALPEIAPKAPPEALPRSKAKAPQGATSGGSADIPEKDPAPPSTPEALPSGDGSRPDTSAKPPPAELRPVGGQASEQRCDVIVELEPVALLGQLDQDTLGCLEQRLASAPKLTEKEKVSVILMVDAWAKGDKARWETLARRHLEEIDQSDPDICYKYALHLARQGPARATGVIRWANTALENRSVWVGETYTSRVYSLYKVRAAASQALWQAAEEDYARTASEASRDKAAEYRSLTKVNAREWYEYAQQSGKDRSSALQLCISAAGTSDYCEAQ